MKIEDNVKGLVVFVMSILVVAYLTGCSFKVEFGYHGETGIKNTTATEMTKK